MNDLGTLGGSNAIAINVNASGKIAGLSDTSTMPNSKTGVPPEHPFLWEPRGNHGKGYMLDAGTIGGTLVYSIAGLNERGEFVGQMSLADEQSFHAFKWNGSKLVDLGTFGGPNSNPFAINEAGSVVGEADHPSGCSGPAQHAVLWRRGSMIDLGVIDGTVRSAANGINAHDQVVGYSFSCDYYSSTAFLWEKGHLYDLNTLIDSSSMYLYFALEINDRGEISGDGLVNGATHAFVLIPCGDGSRGCGNAVQGGVNRERVGKPPLLDAIGRRMILSACSGARHCAHYFRKT
jgi:probable HAF family extracellular repeat protein